MLRFLKMGLFVLAYANVWAAMQLKVATAELSSGTLLEPFTMTWWIGNAPVGLIALWVLTVAVVLVHNKLTSGRFFSALPRATTAPN